MAQTGYIRWHARSAQFTGNPREREASDVPIDPPGGRLRDRRSRPDVHGHAGDRRRGASVERHDPRRRRGGALPWSHTADTSDATDAAEANDTCAGTHAGKTIWYELTLAADTWVWVSTGDTSFDTTIGVWQADGVTQEACNANNRAFGLQAKVVFRALAGQTYLLQVGGERHPVTWTLPSGQLTTDVEVMPAPSGDDHWDALEVDGLP